MKLHRTIFYLTFLFILTNSTITKAQQTVKYDSLKRVQIEEILIEKKINQFGIITRIDSFKLKNIQSRSLGETLSSVPGVQNFNYGPNLGMPMIRSLSGSRVKVLENNVSLNDLSGISPNLNPLINFENVHTIDLYKSGASVLYGGKAIGGAVNLKDQTIPDHLKEKAMEGKLSMEFGTNNGHRQAVEFSRQLGKKWVLQIGGMNQKNNGFKIPGNTKPDLAYDPTIDPTTENLAQVIVDYRIVQNISLYPYLSQFVLEKLNDPEYGLSQADVYTHQQFSTINGQKIENQKNEKYIAGQPETTDYYTKEVYGISDYYPVTKGIMPNSHSDSKGVNFGTAFFHRDLKFGVGFKANEGYFGIPAYAEIKKQKDTHNHGTPSEKITYFPINTRTLNYVGLFDASYIPTDLTIKKITMNYAYSNGNDRELLGIYKVNQFNNKRHTLRSEVDFQPYQFWMSTIGFDYSNLELHGEGLMRYLPNTKSKETGIFNLHQFKVKFLQLDLGYRHDWTSRSAYPDPTYKTSRGLAGGKLSARNYNLNQFSSGLRMDINKFLYAKISYNHSERAPELNELYAGNNHFAIVVEENGDDRLNKETANSVELEAQLNLFGFTLNTNIYQTDFKNYLYLAHTGMSSPGGFTIKEWRASDTKISGFETSLQYQKNWSKDKNLMLSAFVDLVKNKNTSDNEMRRWAEGDYMPNLPTSRYGLQWNAKYDRWSLYGTLDHYFQQKYLGKSINLEKPMPAYSLLSSRISYTLPLLGYELTMYIAGNNLLNEEARPQNSIFKFLAPLPGRNISFGLKMNI